MSKKVVGLLLVVAFFSVGTAYAAIEASGLETFSAVWEAITESNSELAILEARIVEMEAKIAELEASAEGSTLDLSTANYVSIWRNIDAGETIKVRHRLGTKKILVYIVGRWWNYGKWEYHQDYYGFNTEWRTNGIPEIKWWGIRWYTQQSNSIMIERGDDDQSYEQVKVYIWTIG